MSELKCRINGNQIEPCAVLAKALEYGNPTFKSKGIFIPERVNINTGEPGLDIAQIHSGQYVGRGVAMCFCPFCGESLKTWKKEATSERD
ncbi:hypothetical protein [Escherichia coli]|uniref:hypothetical protein n=1 Tax=Escherichia coli TaxID=562 RepID=UPI000BE4C9A8|nr:hypothetical protein [Escherichia coli]EEX0488903.1 hypothetical protein [Escherichia coli]EFB4427624.1 hypothetical protein [Escherichia coli]EFC8022078.1 hypothetical protein [Escherichia coli]EFD0788740.1 hypothetical protein [Escherichia coli]EFD0798793.1 hypothetical protein [Escherichia coli]